MGKLAPQIVHTCSRHQSSAQPGSRAQKVLFRWRLRAQSSCIRVIGDRVMSPHRLHRRQSPLQADDPEHGRHANTSAFGSAVGAGLSQVAVRRFMPQYAGTLTVPRNSCACTTCVLSSDNEHCGQTRPCQQALMRQQCPFRSGGHGTHPGIASCAAGTGRGATPPAPRGRPGGG